MCLKKGSHIEVRARASWEFSDKRFFIRNCWFTETEAFPYSKPISWKPSLREISLAPGRINDQKKRGRSLLWNDPTATAFTWMTGTSARTIPRITSSVPQPSLLNWPQLWVKYQIFTYLGRGMPWASSQMSQWGYRRWEHWPFSPNLPW